MNDENNQDWKLMPKEELELQYSPSKWSKRCKSDDIIVNYINLAKKVHQELKESNSARLDILYDDKLRTKINFFDSDLPEDSPILICVHGGYWQELSKEDFSFPVKQMHSHQISTAIVGYTLAPEATLGEIIDEIQKAVDYVCQLADSRKSKGVYLMGWSAGAQLISQVASITHNTKVHWEYLKGIICISGVYQIGPLVEIYVNDALKLNRNSGDVHSPVKAIDQLKENRQHLKISIFYGQEESTEFKRQSKEYARLLTKNGLKAVDLEEIPGVDHFNIIERLLEEDFLLTQRILKFILG